MLIKHAGAKPRVDPSAYVAPRIRGLVLFLIVFSRLKDEMLEEFGGRKGVRNFLQTGKTVGSAAAG